MIIGNDYTLFYIINIKHIRSCRQYQVRFMRFTKVTIIISKFKKTNGNLGYYNIISRTKRLAWHNLYFWREFTTKNLQQNSLAALVSEVYH